MALGPLRPRVGASGRGGEEDIPGSPFLLPPVSDQGAHLTHVCLCGPAECKTNSYF